MDKPAVILLSGGLDSATAAAIARDEGFQPYALTVDYGQRHRFELQAARRIARAMDVHRHAIVKVDLAQFGGSALTDAIPVPKDPDPKDPDPKDPDPKDRDDHPTDEQIPITYVPARNTVLLSLAVSYAEVIGAADLFIGVNAVDYSGYPDCRGEFIEAFARLANLATRAGVQGRLDFTVHAPLIDLSKAEIIRRGVQLGVDYGLTHTCYDPHPAGVSCGRCDACRLRLKGFAEAGLEDPLEYRVAD